MAVKELWVGSKELKELSQMLCCLEVCAVNELMFLGLKKWMS